VTTAMALKCDKDAFALAVALGIVVYEVLYNFKFRLARIRQA